ncbi:MULTISPECIES: M1 family metallopeptidase [unclassified Duganella]|uniref:M1 family metallopeptidase n=1 Tax=unclassified Duganella TaxID=2636909 RepID=UPI0006FE6611|nr:MULTISPECIES: M1 family metallopeptidase [unclassified Duganella]KQV45462.1 peptidase M1 [Duganella sp. Root336D2]KRC00723.1 peptidase M1 [Duganella sp. Root198D2]
MRTFIALAAVALLAGAAAPQAEIPTAPRNAAAVSVPSAPNAWGGMRTGQEATLSERVVDYKIEASLDPVKHTVEGRQRLTWRNRSSEPVRSVYLHLYLNAFQNPGSTYFTEQRKSGNSFRSGVDTKDGEWGYIDLRSVQQNGASVPWKFVQPDGGPVTDRTVVRMDLPQAVAPGASTTLDIGFFDQLPRVVSRTGYFGTFHLVGQWFPKIAVLELPGERGATAPRWNAHEFHAESEFYADFGNYDVKLTVPKGYTVGATGELQGQPVEKEGKLTHHFVQGDVHDFAWTADSRSAKPLTDTWIGAGSPPVKITVLFPPEYASNAAPALKATRDSLDYFSKTLGPYPYRTVTVVIPPYNAREAAGMEYPTFFTADAYKDVTPGTLSAFELDFVTIHEFGHGYFYGILASNEFEEPMLDEGLNQYWNTRMLSDLRRTVDATTPLLGKLGFAPRFNVWDVERAMTPREEPSDPLGASAFHRLQGVGPVYSRTATTMHDLEAQLGRDVIERAFKEYYRRWKFRHPSLADFREVLSEVSGNRRLVEQVFAQQVYSVNRVDDRISKFTSAEVLPLPGVHVENGKHVELTEEEVEKRIGKQRKGWKEQYPDAKENQGPYPYHTIVTVRRRGADVLQTLVVTFADGTTEIVLWDGAERWRTFEWTRPSKAVSAELDPGRQHYLDANKLDDSRTLKSDGRAARRWSFDFAAIVQTLLSFIATL